MDIWECERKAKADGAYNTATFDLVGPNGSVKVKWLDAYFGTMIAEGEQGFWMTRDIADQAVLFGISVENYQPNN